MMPCHNQNDTGFSFFNPGFNASAVHVGFVLDSVALGKAFLYQISFHSSVNTLCCSIHLKQPVHDHKLSRNITPNHIFKIHCIKNSTRWPCILLRWESFTAESWKLHNDKMNNKLLVSSVISVKWHNLHTKCIFSFWFCNQMWTYYLLINMHIFKYFTSFFACFNATASWSSSDYRCVLCHVFTKM